MFSGVGLRPACLLRYACSRWLRHLRTARSSRPGGSNHPSATGLNPRNPRQVRGGAVRAMSSITTSTTTRARANLSVSVRVALVLLGIAIAAFGVDFAGNRIPPTSTSRKQLVEAIDDYAMPVCHAALLAAATMLAFRLLAVLKRPGHR